MSRRYRDALNAISTRTGAPLSSLVLSFAVLHELTALVPLVGTFYAARGLHVGEHVVNQLTPSAGHTGWVAGQLSKWVDDGERWAHRVGRRYGMFGLDKGTPIEHGQLAGDVANAVVAYATTKALLPVRIGVSLYLSPAFSRAVVDPVRRTVIRSLKKYWSVPFLQRWWDDFVAAPVVADGL